MKNQTYVHRLLCTFAMVVFISVFNPIKSFACSGMDLRHSTNQITFGPVYASEGDILEATPILGDCTPGTPYLYTDPSGEEALIIAGQKESMAQEYIVNPKDQIIAQKYRFHLESMAPNNPDKIFVLANATIPADVTRDGEVNSEDMIDVISYWGSDNYFADINGDGLVDVLDFIELFINWDD